MAHIVKEGHTHRYHRLNDWQLYCRCGYVMDTPEPGASDDVTKSSEPDYHASSGSYADSGVWWVVTQPTKRNSD